MIENSNLDLRIFIDQVIELLHEVDRAGLILFSVNFRKNYTVSVNDVVSLLEQNKEYFYNYEQGPELKSAGLTGSQLALKLESFEYSYKSLHNDGGLDNLEDALGKSGIILGSLCRGDHKLRY